MRPTWSRTWMEVALAVGKRSACVRAQVGAVVVDPHNRIIATGYNGPPAAYIRTNADTCESYCARSMTDDPQPHYLDCVAIHAEANALLFCDRRDRMGGTIYVSSPICWECGKLIANSGLSQVIYAADDVASHRQPQEVVTFMRAAGLSVHPCWLSST